MLVKCFRGCHRTNLADGPGPVNFDLSSIFQDRLKETLSFMRKGGHRERCGGLYYEPDTYILDVVKTPDADEVDFYPLDTDISLEQATEYSLTLDEKVLSEKLDLLVKAHALNYNRNFRSFGGESILRDGKRSWVSKPVLFLGSADTITGLDIGLGYLFLVGDNERGYRLESECSFKFTTVERR